MDRGGEVEKKKWRNEERGEGRATIKRGAEVEERTERRRKGGGGR